jgi:hypothetical protein
MGRLSSDRVHRRRAAARAIAARLGMTPLLPELSAPPVAATLDGELVAFDDDGPPGLPVALRKMPMRRRGTTILGARRLSSAMPSRVPPRGASDPATGNPTAITWLALS